MKNNLIIITSILVMAFVSGCQAQKPSNTKVSEDIVSYLIDCTDKELFKEINDDLHTNLNVFFGNVGISKVGYNEKLTVRIAPIDDNDKLALKTASVALTNKNASKREQAAMSDTKPLLRLVSTELARYDTVCNRKMKCSPIINVMLKTFREMNPDAARELLVVCTDGVEFSSYANLYKAIPTTDEAVSKVVGKVDGILLNEAKDKIAETNPQVIFVLKANPKANIANLKLFYTKLMGQLGVTSVSFIDNLSNNPNLY